MTRAEQFAADLQKKASAGGPQSVQSHWEEQRELWIADLKDLCENIKTWLQPAIEAKAARVVDVNFSTTEPDLGTYDAPGLRIELLVDSPVSVDIRPRGCRVVGLVQTGKSRVFGSQGRVDIERGADREIILRFKEADAVRWNSYATGAKQTVDEGVFLDLLSNVAGLNFDDA